MNLMRGKRASSFRHDRRDRRVLWFCCAVAVLATCSIARADTIVLSQGGGTISGVTIESIRGGQVSFVDQAGRKQHRSVAEVRSLQLDTLPRLAEAETLAAAGDHAGALQALIVSMVQTDNDVHRLWLHARLSRTHDRLNEYVESAGHAAAVFAMDDDPSWTVLEPVCDPRKRTTPLGHLAMAEAHEQIRASQRSVKSSALKQALERMSRVVEPLHAQLSKSLTGVVPARGSTISGVPREQIIASLKAGSGTDGGTRVETPKSPLTTGTSGRGGGTSDTAAGISSATHGDGTREAATTPPSVNVNEATADAIESLLTAGRWAEAAEHCEQSARTTAPADRARLLHQFGLALRGVGNLDQALVMLTRAAVLFEDSPYGSKSLVETALLYRDTLKQPETAKRLLEHAVERATVYRHAAEAERANALLRTMP